MLTVISISPCNDEHPGDLSLHYVAGLLSGCHFSHDCKWDAPTRAKLLKLVGAELSGEIEKWRAYKKDGKPVFLVTARDYP